MRFFVLCHGASVPLPSLWNNSRVKMKIARPVKNKMKDNIFKNKLASPNTKPGYFNNKNRGITTETENGNNITSLIWWYILTAKLKHSGFS